MHGFYLLAFTKSFELLVSRVVGFLPVLSDADDFGNATKSCKRETSTRRVKLM